MPLSRVALKFDDAAPGSMILSDHAARSMICQAICTVGGSSMTRFGLDDSQKKRPFASLPMTVGQKSARRGRISRNLWPVRGL